MGYQTDFKVSSEPAVSMLDKILKEETEYDFEDGRSTDSIKWYDHAEDMKRISLQIPNTLFTVDGNGEENGDIWRNFFKDGKMGGGLAELVYPEYNPEEME